MYKIVMMSSAKYSLCMYIISVAVRIYNGRVIKSSYTLLRAPRVKASEGVLADLARELSVLAYLRGMNSSVFLALGER